MSQTLDCNSPCAIDRGPRMPCTRTPLVDNWVKVKARSLSCWLAAASIVYVLWYACGHSLGRVRGGTVSSKHCGFSRRSMFSDLSDSAVLTRQVILQPIGFLSHTVIYRLEKKYCPTDRVHCWMRYHWRLRNSKFVPMLLEQIAEEHWKVSAECAS